jgi:hypothetical protein
VGGRARDAARQDSDRGRRLDNRPSSTHLLAAAPVARPARNRIPQGYQPEGTMAKGQQSKKDEKKKPTKTLMEKRAEKRAKKAAKG